ncbi:MAG TPA: hypothetical protein VH500_25050 [Nitrososphaeraceae archaeon]|jgi:hypothetical protein
MTTEESEDSPERGEVSLQEQQKIAEESSHIGPGERRDPKNRGEVSLQEQQKIAEESG